MASRTFDTDTARLRTIAARSPHTAATFAHLCDGQTRRSSMLPCTGVGDDPIDNAAVELGYELYEKYPNDMTEEQYAEEIANAGLS